MQIPQEDDSSSTENERGANARKTCRQLLFFSMRLGFCIHTIWEGLQCRYEICFHGIYKISNAKKYASMHLVRNWKQKPVYKISRFVISSACSHSHLQGGNVDISMETWYIKQRAARCKIISITSHAADNKQKQRTKQEQPMYGAKLQCNSRALNSHHIKTRDMAILKSDLHRETYITISPLQRGIARKYWHLKQLVFHRPLHIHWTSHANTSKHTWLRSNSTLLYGEFSQNKSSFKTILYWL